MCFPSCASGGASLMTPSSALPPPPSLLTGSPSGRGWMSSVHFTLQNPPPITTLIIITLRSCLSWRRRRKEEEASGTIRPNIPIVANRSSCKRRIWTLISRSGTLSYAYVFRLSLQGNNGRIDRNMSESRRDKLHEIDRKLSKVTR